MISIQRHENTTSEEVVVCVCVHVCVSVCLLVCFSVCLSVHLSFFLSSYSVSNIFIMATVKCKLGELEDHCGFLELGECGGIVLMVKVSTSCIHYAMHTHMHMHKK